MKLIRMALAATLLVVLPTLAKAQALPTQPLSSPSVGGSWIVSNTPVKATRLAVTSGAAAGYFMVFDATVVPPDGALTSPPVFCAPVGANTRSPLIFFSPAKFLKGLVLVFSTTGCYTKTVSNTAYFEASPL